MQKKSLWSELRGLVIAISSMICVGTGLIAWITNGQSGMTMAALFFILAVIAIIAK